MGNSFSITGFAPGLYILCIEPGQHTTLYSKGEAKSDTYNLAAGNVTDKQPHVFIPLLK